MSGNHDHVDFSLPGSTNSPQAARGHHRRSIQFAEKDDEKPIPSRTELSVIESVADSEAPSLVPYDRDSGWGDFDASPRQFAVGSDAGSIAAAPAGFFGDDFLNSARATEIDPTGANVDPAQVDPTFDGEQRRSSSKKKDVKQALKGNEMASGKLPRTVWIPWGIWSVLSVIVLLIANLVWIGQNNGDLREDFAMEVLGSAGLKIEEVLEPSKNLANRIWAAAVTTSTAVDAV